MNFRRFAVLIASIVLLLHIPAAARSAGNVISLSVDLRDAPRNILHTHMTIPVEPGKLTLLYPKYIPGEHGPTGPIVDLTVLHFEVGGKEVVWRRDLVDMWTFHLDIPAGASELEAKFDFLAPASQGRFSSGVFTTPDLAILNWNQVVLYPAGKKTSEIQIQPSLTLPEAWQHGTALEEQSHEENLIHFMPVSLETLVDSPVLCARYFRSFDIAPSNDVPHHLDVASDDPHSLDANESDIEHYRELVTQAHALFGSRHYRHYDFLLTLSDLTAHFGLEHHQSSDDRTSERYFQDPKLKLASVGLLPHEFVHSWNGKYRRPADLSTPDYEKPMKTDLLWVYEGLTTYLGNVLTARSGLWTAEQYRDALASTASSMSHRPGSTWRPLQDTADAAQILYGSPSYWSNWRRGTDFYADGALIWLDVDTKIRELSHDEHSLDDFCRLFYGIHDGEVAVRTYSFDEVVAGLQKVVDYDWAKFMRVRLDRIGPDAPLDGLARSGWKMEYTDTPSDYQKANDQRHRRIDVMDSIGLIIDDENRVVDVLWDGPAYKAGISPGMTLVAVNERQFSYHEPERLTEAIEAAKTSSDAIQLLMEKQSFYHSYAVDYHGGNRYPHLVRDDSKPDWLSEIIAPRRGE